MNSVLLAVLLLGGAGLLLGIGLGLAAHFMAVKENETALKIASVLPGANCGACGFSGCAGYAAALAESRNVRSNLCLVGGDDVAKEIAAILGTAPRATVKTTARVACRGTAECRGTVADYEGILSCRAAASLYNGGSACAYGCLGCGDCAAVCDRGAITVRLGVAVVDEAVCVGCGKCASACPKSLIVLVPAASATVLCRNPQKGAETKAVCTAGCLGCRMCEKACPSGAVVMEGNVARILSEKCTGCGACVAACRPGVVHNLKEIGNI